MSGFRCGRRLAAGWLPPHRLPRNTPSTPMIVTWDWLNEYVRLDMPVEEFENRLMMAGLNHESTLRIDGQIAIDLEVTSNRPDCLGHLGIAREAAVLFNRELKLPAAQPRTGKTPVTELTSVEIQCPDLCPRYTARVIRGVKVGPSPQWLVDRLAALFKFADASKGKPAAWKPVNNIVDITNYVMMECGQPLHAFDYNRLAERRIVVREARKGEKLEAIDHKVYELEPGMCVIADAKKPVGLGGVMGGADTEVSDTTVDLLIEAAEFNPLSIRNTARTLKLFSPSSFRFSRGLDPEGVDWASRRCCELILELAGGELAEGVIDAGRRETPRREITLRFSQLKRILGIDIDRAEVLRILAALGNTIQGDPTPERVTVTAPSWRRDLTREIDLVEEVARIHGYDKIPEDVQVPMASSRRSRREQVLDRVRKGLNAAGYDEALTLSAVPEAWSNAFSPWTDQPALQTPTPIIKGADRLRRSLVPSLLDVRRINQGMGNADVELFEIANVYLSRPTELPEEVRMIGLTSGGSYYDVQGAILGLLEDLHCTQQLEYRPLEQPLFTERSAELWLGGERLGVLGEVSPEGLETFGLRSPATCGELKFEVLEAAAQLVPQYTKTSDYPGIVQDINLVLAEKVRWDEVRDVVVRHGGPLLEQVNYQETYRTPKLAEAGKKKVLFQVAFRSPTETLTQDQAREAHTAIFAACQQAFGAELG